MDDSDANENDGREDEYDALNDETFGDEGAEYNWEESHNLIAQSIGRRNQTNGSNYGLLREQEATNENHVGGAYADFCSPYIGQSKETDYDDFENDNALEESISRLVLDEYDENEDEEEAKNLKLQRLGGNTNYHTYFMPPQVANKHLHWLMDKELPGGSSLLGSSVWSMHPTTTSQTGSSHDLNPSIGPTSTPTVANNANTYSPPRGITGVKNEVFNSPLAGSNLGDLLGVQKNQEESPIRPPPGMTMKPTFRTVDELEKELLRDTKNEKTPVSLGGDSGGGNRRPKIISVEELEREMIQACTPRATEVVSTQTPPRQVHQGSQASPAIQPLHAQQAVHPSVASVMSAQNNRPPPGIPSPGLNVSPMIMMRPGLQNRMQHSHGRPMSGLSPAAFAQNILSAAGLPPSANIHLSPLQQQQLRFMQMNPQFRNRMPPFGMPFNAAMALRQGYPVPPGYPLLPHGQHFRRMPPGNNMKTEDPFRGLMNDKDKQRLRNIQIIQLQNDHPYTTDYYCLMNNIRNARTGSDPLKNREGLMKLFPKLEDNPSKHQYQPAHFENSLGKLQAVSALAPKKAIDTVIRVVDAGPSTRAGPKAYRYLLLEIEKLYECLLNIEEADIRLSLLCNGDELQVQLRKENTAKVVKTLKSKEKVSEILGVRKGKMLISRLIPLMDSVIRYLVFNHLLRTFPVWANNMEVEKAYPYLRHCIFTAEGRDLLMTTDAIEQKVYLHMVKTKLGLSVLLGLLHQAEQVILKSQMAGNFTQLWNNNARIIALAILFQENDCTVPTEIFSDMCPHLQRFGFESVELIQLDIIWRKWAEAGVPVL